MLEDWGGFMVPIVRSLYVMGRKKALLELELEFEFQFQHQSSALDISHCCKHSSISMTTWFFALRIAREHGHAHSSTSQSVRVGGKTQKALEGPCGADSVWVYMAGP
jgi:hypothetical protein